MASAQVWDAASGSQSDSVWAWLLRLQLLWVLPLVYVLRLR
jgi:hypothetical protein